MKNTTFLIILILVFSFFATSCSKNKMDPNRPLSAKEKRIKNINEGSGVSLKGIIGNRGQTQYDFSSSNPMWRASLETLDFLPLTTVDYSGGVIITDWYSETDNREAIKVTLRFLSNEIRADSLKIIIHKKKCKTSLNCVTNISESNLIKDELRSTILRKAALMEKSSKIKK